MLADIYGLGPESAWALEGFRCASASSSRRARSSRNAGLPPDARGKKGESLAVTRRAPARPPVTTAAARSLTCASRTHPRGRAPAYAFAGYLMEARPERLARLLDELGHGARERSPAESIERELGLDATALDARVARWAAEMGE